MKRITILTLLFFISSYTKLSAAIVYTDINDVTLQIGGAIDIDFDGDGLPEFTFEDQGFGGQVEPGVIFNNVNEHFTTVSLAEWDVIQGVPLNTTIDMNSNWFDQGDAYVDPGWGTTLFPTTDTYIGASFEVGGNTHYGWIFVNWDGNGTFVIKSYAYETDNNTPILAGATNANTNVMVNSITLSTANGETTVAVGDDLQVSAAILPLNASNTDVTWTIVNGSGTATIDANGLLSALTLGTITVVATANDGSGITAQIQINITEVTPIVDNGNTDPILDPGSPLSEVESSVIYVPSVFTPNAGNINKTFEVIADNIEDFKMIIYNRWGEVVYVSYDQRVAWDGSYAGRSNPNEMYVWKINYRDAKGQKNEIIGQVLVLI
ncbi:hypothetical protein DNU06_06900 [Putridiphycobacter roseus]|uniref:BIG2 domain-containing protein n=1 Tax=Putridiphycobacter roseus TaxID=2219161 RepID=A0A2W1N1W0_9FLAO|nr:gliding motility-associated C-terminal domain-containing protein [Putridiphycobacter roseus]PZE17550.1 hypothetical protein DNU06_06900 [Putridiphycobacter roseus]